MSTDKCRSAPTFLFPLLAVTQVGSALAFIGYLVDDSPATSGAQVDFELAALPYSPLLWLGLGLVGIVSLVTWRAGRWRTIAVVSTSVSGAFGLLGTALVALTFVTSSYGADFDYPDEPPLPAFAQPVARADGFDDDDPMRGREIVIDTGAQSKSELVQYYREQFAATDGWIDGTPEADVGGGQTLCLVNHAHDGYDEYLEMYPHGNRFKSGGPHRSVVSLSRLSVMKERGARTANRCGLAGIWFPSNL